MPEPGGLNPGTEPLDGRTADDFVALAGGSTEDELAGPDRGLEHSALYAVLFVVLAGGAMLLSRPEGLRMISLDDSTHTLMEAVATLLAFLVGTLALVRYYSRKQITFLLIGCGFLGAGILDLNHLVGTLPGVLEARAVRDSAFDDEAMYAWTWTAGRVYLSLFLFMSLIAWRQEVKAGQAEGFSEATVYGTALVLSVVNLLFFEYAPLASLTVPQWVVSRPAEMVPALFFGLAFAGFYKKGSWRRDQFDHWMMVSLLIAALGHGAFMAFSEAKLDVMSDGAHLLKIASLLAVLTGLLHSVYSTFTREAAVLEALKGSNDALAREVDFRAKTEEAVKESSARLQRFLDNANDLIQNVDRDGRFQYVNRSWKRVLGYSNEDLERMSLFDIVHPEHRAELKREFNRLYEGGDPEPFHTEYVAADGRLVILSGSTQLQMAGDQPVATQTILRDVTEQRLAEQRLDESQRNLEALVENTGDSIWSVDRNHRLITMNSAFSLAIEARTGQEPQVGQFPNDLFDEDDAQWYRELYAKTLSGSRHVDVRSDTVDGHLRYFEMYANPIQSVDGVVGAVFFGKDVTDRVRAEEALRVAKEEAEAANKAKSDFLANMSHELRTPLNSVIGFTNILLKNKDGRLDDKDIGFLTRVLTNGKHLLALINEVLDLAKVEAGRMELIIEEIDLAHLCVETVQQLEGQAKAKDGDVKLVADVPESVKLVETDSAKLKQVIINLVGNALKFTHEGSVTVRLELADDGATPTAISVVDTGIGIPDDRLEAIFEAFQQAEAGMSRKYGGTGLGLALSRSICLLMGYDLIVESEVGQGSTFKIVMGARAERPVRPDDDEAPTTTASSVTTTAAAVTDSPDDARTPAAVAPKLDSASVASSGEDGRGTARNAPLPVAGGPDAVGAGAEDLDGAGDDTGATAVVGEGKDAPARAGPRDGTNPPAAKPGWSDFKVLVVDDEKDSRVLIEHFLEDFGCQVFTATNGAEGLEMARSVQPDLMTLDLIMPEMTGWEVLKRAKADPELREIPIVVVSVVANEGRGKLLGAVDLVTKPFEREDLLRVLWRNLGRRRGGRVLLMVGDADRKAELAGVVSEHGLEVRTSAERDVMAALAQESPDAVVLDLSLPNLHGVASLLELRESRVHTGLPVLVLTRPDLNEREREMVGELATVYSQPDGADEKLARMLEASFQTSGHRVAGG